MTREPLKITITGAGGRMGQAIVRVAQSEGVTLVGAVEHAASPLVGRDVGEVAGVGTIGVSILPDLAAGMLGADCVIDFSAPAVVPQVAHVAARAGIALVSGTTGLGPEAEAALDAAAKRVPVLWSANMSVGVFVLAELVKLAARMLPGFDVEIVETHHRLKADAPSGTALRLLSAVKEEREGRMVTGREGQPGARLADEIGVLAMRGGDVVGDHTVHFLGAGERLEFTHRATSRDLFARGAVRAAISVAGRGPGRYGMRDVAGV